MQDGRSIERFDFYLFCLLCALLGMSLLIIFGATSSSGVMRSKAYTQLAAVVIGIALVIMMQLVDYRTILDNAYTVYWSCVGLLLGVLVFGLVAKGSKSWFVVPVIGFRFQPSELMKVGLIIGLARCLSKRDRSLDGLKEMLIPLILIGIPFLLVLAQHDAGTALVFPLVAMAMFWAAGVRKIYLFLLLSPALGIMGIRGGFVSLFIFAVLLFILFRIAIKVGVPWLDWCIFLAVNVVSYFAAPMAWEFLKPHQRQRLMVFLEPNVDPMGISWNLIQSKVALGSGGFWGKGWQQGTQIRGQFLPAFHTDFAFSVLGEEWGFVGCLILMVIFFLFLIHGLEIAQSTRYLPGALVVVGVVALFFIHILVNVGMCMGLMPIIGIPLCFISYGGSALVANALAASFLFNVQIHRFK
ncbi:MAG TPA: rod shape-determining protein RodA [bacterium]|nr:rod shape-determining protein RodA [bacterium]